MLFSPGCWSMLLRIGCFLYVTVYNYVCFSMLLLIGYFSMSLHMLFPQSTCVVFFGVFYSWYFSPCCCLRVLLIMRYFFRVAMDMWFSPYWCFEVLLSMFFLSSCCKIVVFSKLLFVGCVFYVAVKPHHLFHNIFLQF